MKSIRSILFLLLALALSGPAAGQGAYATPDMVGNPGPFPAGTDFYFVSAAGNVGVNYVAGDVSLLKKPGQVALLFDVSKVQFGKENFFEDYREVEDKSEVEDILSRATAYFRVEFNRKNKDGVQIVKKGEEGDTPYNMVVRLRKLNKGNATGFWFDLNVKSGSAHIDGTIELVDKQTGDILCVFGFNKIEGTNHATKKTRIGLTFGDLGNKFGKLVRDKF